MEFVCHFSATTSAFEDEFLLQIDEVQVRVNFCVGRREEIFNFCYYHKHILCNCQLCPVWHKLTADWSSGLDFENGSWGKPKDQLTAHDHSHLSRVTVSNPCSLQCDCSITAQVLQGTWSPLHIHMCRKVGLHMCRWLSGRSAAKCNGGLSLEPLKKMAFPFKCSQEGAESNRSSGRSCGDAALLKAAEKRFCWKEWDRLMRAPAV